MKKIKVLLVDDSAVIRKVLGDLISADPELEVVGTAANGKIALEQLKLLNPDVITLDIEMPEMDGLEALKALRASGSDIPVIMFSKYTSEGATATLEALELGASDAVAKPEARGGGGIACEAAKRQLTSRIRALGRRARRKEASPAKIAEDGPQKLVSVPARVEAIGLAVSTGGPKALIELVSALAPNLSAPIFITQHMPPMFTKFLAERLSARGTITALEGEDGMPVEAGKVYIAPGNFHLEVVPGILAGPPPT